MTSDAVGKGSRAAVAKRLRWSPLAGLLRGFRRSQGGGVLIKAAFTLPLLLLMAAGIVEVGRAVYAQDALAEATRSAVRYAIVRGAASPEPATAGDIRERLRGRATGLDPGRLEVTVTYEPDNNPGSFVRVEADYRFELLLHAFPVDPITLHSRSRMMISQ